jgi:3-mercaptopyruvate sulfurtransferase SseA
MSRGFTDVQVLLGGFAAWKEAGLPVETTAP